ncbi:MAG: lipid-A-disaccharide synthase [Gammaproteobacteria bacterium]|nr:lipid-A-disaccharide synthase [Gammaproteobacteria bacterium]
MKKKILIVSGEESGDMYASEIIKKIESENFFDIYAMGSSKVKETSAKLILDSKELSVTGIYEVIKMYPKLLKALESVKNVIKTQKPDLIVLIDYQEFNIKIAKYAKELNLKVLFYIGPQVWAWRRNRVYSIKKYIDKMAVIFPFEEKIFEECGVNVCYVGHPLTYFQKKKYTSKEKGSKKNFNIGFFPGSRENEVNRLLPVINKCIKSLEKGNNNLNFIVSKSKNLNKSSFLKNITENSYTKIEEVNDINETIGKCDIAVAASGTITLQLALSDTPMCVMYKLSPITYFIAKYLVSTKYISLVNILAEKLAVKEFIQNNVNEVNIVAEVKKLLYNRDYNLKVKEDLSKVRSKLEDNKSRDDIIDIIYEMAAAED